MIFFDCNTEGCTYLYSTIDNRNPEVCRKEFYDIYNQLVDADRSNRDDIVLVVPKSNREDNWPFGYYAKDRFSKALYKLGVLSREIHVEKMIADSNKNVELGLEGVKSDAKLIYKNTARIDVKNLGIESNHIEFISTSTKESFREVIWWRDEKGIGYSLESNENVADIKLKCHGDGALNISLKGVYRKDRNNHDKRIPLEINYTKLLVNGETIFDESKVLWHDSPYNYVKEVKDNEIVAIHLEWKSVENE